MEEAVENGLAAAVGRSVDPSPVDLKSELSPLLVPVQTQFDLEFRYDKRDRVLLSIEKLLAFLDLLSLAAGQRRRESPTVVPAEDSDVAAAAWQRVLSGLLSKTREPVFKGPPQPTRSTGRGSRLTKAKKRDFLTGSPFFFFVFY